MEANGTNLEPSLEEFVGNHIGPAQKREQISRDASRFDGEKPRKRDSGLAQLQLHKRQSLMELSSNHRNGFSRSLGDLSLINSTNVYRRKSVIFEEDLNAHAVVLERARSRFRELELKYPEVFKNSSPRNSPSSSLALNRRSASVQSVNRIGFARSASPTCVVSPRSRIQREESLKETDKLGDLTRFDNGSFTLTTKAKPPPLSANMRSHNLEDSCDSAFDELDRERISPDRSPNSSGSKTTDSRFLYPGDSLESDKDSGISTDRPFIPKPRAQNPHRPVTWASDSLDSSISSVKSKSLSTLLDHGHEQTKSSDLSDPDNHVYKRSPADRRGILKSAAYRNQGVKTGSLDLPNHQCNYQEHSNTRTLERALHGNPKSTGSNVYQRMSHYPPSSVSQDEGNDSDVETIYSFQSEVLVRPRMSARQQYLSTYSLDRTSFDSTHENRVHKARSLPNLNFETSSFDHATGFGGEIIEGNTKKKRKRILQRFGNRSGIYVVNDTPDTERPRLPNTKASKKSKKSKRKKSVEVTHVTESTKDWFDHTTAVSRPTGGQSLGRIVTMREDIGMAYEIELQRPINGLFGFFIQKGYKQFRKGIFISRIMDSKSAKFLAGLLNPGDELVEINGDSTKTKTTAEVHNIMAHSERLLLTVLPFIGRKDW